MPQQRGGRQLQPYSQVHYKVCILTNQQKHQCPRNNHQIEFLGRMRAKYAWPGHTLYKGMVNCLRAITTSRTKQHTRNPSNQKNMTKNSPGQMNMSTNSQELPKFLPHQSAIPRVTKGLRLGPFLAVLDEVQYFLKELLTDPTIFDCCRNKLCQVILRTTRSLFSLRSYPFSINILSEGRKKTLLGYEYKNQSSRWIHFLHSYKNMYACILLLCFSFELNFIILFSLTVSKAVICSS